MSFRLINHPLIAASAACQPVFKQAKPTATHIPTNYICFIFVSPTQLGLAANMNTSRWSISIIFLQSVSAAASAASVTSASPTVHQFPPPRLAFAHGPPLRRLRLQPAGHAFHTMRMAAELPGWDGWASASWNWCVGGYCSCFKSLLRRLPPLSTQRLLLVTVWLC